MAFYCQAMAQSGDLKLIEEKEVDEITYVYTQHPEGWSVLENKANYQKAKGVSGLIYVNPSPSILEVFRGVVPKETVLEYTDKRAQLATFVMFIDHTGKIREVYFSFRGKMPFTFEQFYEFEKRIKEHSFKMSGERKDEGLQVMIGGIRPMDL